METLQSDNEIIEKIKHGETARYELLISKYNQRIYRVCRAYLKDEAEIEDVMQDAYLKAYQNLEKFEARASFSTWLTRIVINESLQRLKKIKKFNFIDGQNIMPMNLSDHQNPETRSLNRELKKLLEKAVEDLPEKYKTVFILREIENINVEETSETLSISPSNVKVRLNRAKEMLRSSLLKSYPLHEVFEFNLVRCERISKNVLAKINLLSDEKSYC